MLVKICAECGEDTVMKGTELCRACQDRFDNELRELMET